MFKSRKKLLFYLVFDICSIIVSWFCALLILKDPSSNIWNIVQEVYWCALIAIVLSIVFFYFFGVYSISSKYLGFEEAIKLGVGVVFVILLNNIIVVVFKSVNNLKYLTTYLNFPWAELTSFFFAVLFVPSRCFERLIVYVGHNVRVKVDKGIRTLIIGAGSAGASISKEMKTSDKIDYIPICFVDDDESKLFQLINGVEVLGTTKDIKKLCRKYDIQEIVIAIATLDRKRKTELINICKETGCRILFVPALYQLVNEQLTVSNLKEVSINDLLGRDQVVVNLEEIAGYVDNKVVLVTGGGGSIGSELCRQIANHKPKQLIILDIYENNAYDIQQELVRNHPELNLEVLIASVRDSVKIDDVFAKYKPQIIFHAAAHKHVPLMEKSPNEAVKNNVCGTLKVARAADRYGAEKFVMISTDKAVNPTNIMGATKRICEMIIQTMNKHSKTEYVAVRFGNVLGSNGSVIPLFKKQIEEGGPVTVTHKDIVRYFMTIPEAVSLVLQAGAYAKGGEIFVLDMGEPVKIYDLAVNMIKLSGLEPYKDIDIKITGLRPGEKLYEERLMAEEGLQKTENSLISIGKPLGIDENHLFEMLDKLYMEAYNETTKMKELVHELVPTYKIDTTNDSKTLKAKKTKNVKESNSIKHHTRLVQVSKDRVVVKKEKKETAKPKKVEPAKQKKAKTQTKKKVVKENTNKSTKESKKVIKENKDEVTA